jgi:hypothetical protein
MHDSVTGFEFESIKPEEIEVEANLDDATRAKLYRMEASRRGGLKRGPTKARKGTGENVRRYWARVYAGEIQHPNYDPKHPKVKRRPRRGQGAKSGSTPIRDDRNALTVIPSPAMGSVSSDIDAEFESVLGGMGL